MKNIPSIDLEHDNYRDVMTSMLVNYLESTEPNEGVSRERPDFSDGVFPEENSFKSYTEEELQSLAQNPRTSSISIRKDSSFEEIARGIGLLHRRRGTLIILLPFN